MSEEKIKKKLTRQFFSFVGPDSISSEDSSTVEYSVCALITANYKKGSSDVHFNIAISWADLVL